MKIIFFLYACLSIYLPMCLCVYLSFCLSANVSIYLSICLFVYVCICLSTSFLSSNPSIYLFTCLFLYLPIYLFVYLSMYFFSQSIHLFSVCLFIYLLSLQWRIWPAKKRHFRNRLGESSVNLKTNSPKDGIYKGGREKKLINFYRIQVKKSFHRRCWVASRFWALNPRNLQLTHGLASMEFFSGVRTKAGIILSKEGETIIFVFDNLDKLFDNLEQCTWAYYEKKYFISNQAQIKKEKEAWVNIALKLK